MGVYKSALEGAFQIAEVHAARGEFDEAFRWLERAHDEHDPGIAQAKASWCLLPLYGDPRWGALMRKVRLEV